MNRVLKSSEVCGFFSTTNVDTGFRSKTNKNGVILFYFNNFRLKLSSYISMYIHTHYWKNISHTYSIQYSMKVQRLTLEYVSLC